MRLTIDVPKQMYLNAKADMLCGADILVSAIKNGIPLETVTPEQKIGHWIMIDEELQRYKCSECGEVIILYKKSEIPKLEKDETLSDYPFSHCGCRMVEPQEK